MHLTHDERAMLEGARGPGTQLAMRLVVAMAEADQAQRLVDIESAHIDGCLYHGQSGIDFADALLTGGAVVQVPTTLNVAAIDMLHPELFRGDAAMAEKSRQLTDAYVQLGCRPTWTCAPYQLSNRPEFGQQLAWGESNAIVFANSVLGARTNRYGDFADICCAVTGKAPYVGLHTDSGRAANIEVVVDVPEHVLESELLYPLLGYLIGQISGGGIPVIVGLDSRADEDRLKALGAAAASSGAVAMFHAVGITPEAPDIKSALAGEQPDTRVVVGIAELNRVRGELTTGAAELGAVSVGTPHMSSGELCDLATLVRGRETRVPFYVNTARGVLEETAAEKAVEDIEGFGATVVTDTCTYITPIIGDVSGAVMTNSAKWAHYAPANLGVDVIFASLEECILSAANGRVVTMDDWH